MAVLEVLYFRAGLEVFLQRVATLVGRGKGLFNGRHCSKVVIFKVFQVFQVLLGGEIERKEREVFKRRRRRKSSDVPWDNHAGKAAVYTSTS